MQNTWDNLTPTMKLLISCVATEVIDGHRESPRLDVSVRFLKLTSLELEEVKELNYYQMRRDLTAQKFQVLSDEKTHKILIQYDAKAFDEPSPYFAEVARVSTQIDCMYEYTKPDGHLISKEDVELGKRVLKARVIASPAREKIIDALDRYIGEDYAKEAISAFIMEYPPAGIPKAAKAARV